MQTSGFSSTPTTLVLLLLCTTISLLASITSTKHHLALYPYPQLYPYLQLQRVVTHQLGHSSSTDLLFSSVLLYQLRVLERALGTRKFVSFVLMSGGWEAVVAPLVLTGVVRPLSWGAWDHIPAGMTAVVMAALAVWAVEVPRLWRWELVVPSFAAMRRRRRRREVVVVVAQRQTMAVAAVAVAVKTKWQQETKEERRGEEGANGQSHSQTKRPPTSSRSSSP
ncbi:hypothetical protein GJ744_000785 [Endocarpon pusillum]|uniref:Peptidase S54 rhomboid domain-containing protein n=1 Tax=Endocarpon pusillum TaxID=364733 RepID=A0A8H7AAB6_9EURO|nr:hypothetical protein GJ744_000785 [Endocarpon pusillum]